MTDEANADTTEVQFEFENSDDEAADLWVDDVFVNSYNDQRAYLEGQTYEAKDVIKFDWDTTHHSFDDETKRWVVDVDALDALAEKLEDAGFVTDFDPGRGVHDTDDGFDDLLAMAETGDRVTVTYQKKNGNGTKTREGVVKRTGETNLRFLDTDERSKFLSREDNGMPAIYSNGQYPFMGVVETVTLEADRELERPDDDEDEPSDEDLPEWAEA